MTASTAVIRRPDGIGFTRMYPHRPEMVFDAFADPVKLAQWWGPPNARTSNARSTSRQAGSGTTACYPRRGSSPRAAPASRSRWATAAVSARVPAMAR